MILGIGINVLGGMLMTTLLAPVLVRWLDLAVQSLRERFHRYFSKSHSK